MARNSVSFPIAERWAMVDGCRMRYLQAGSGPPLLMIHGLMGYAFSWRLNIPALAQAATVYAVDLLGMGLSERSSALDCSLRGTAERMLRFMEAVGITSADVLGTSHGGALAMMLAALAAEGKKPVVRRLILVAPVNPWSAHGRILTRWLSTALGRSLFQAVSPGLRRMHGYFLDRMFGDRRRIPADSAEGYAIPLAIPGTIEHALGIVKCWHRDLKELESVLPRIAEIPILLLWGSRDPAVLPQSAPRLKEHFSRAELVMMEGVGHLAYEESPEEFNRLVLEFLRKGFSH